MATAGIALSILFVSPDQPSKDGNGEDLPPELTPSVSSESTSIAISPISFFKNPKLKEVIPGQAASFVVAIENTTKEALRNVLVEERFNDEVLSVLDAAGGGISKNKLAWRIPLLYPRERWSVRYTMFVSEDSPTEDIQTTTYVLGSDIEHMASSDRMASTLLRIIALPPTGSSSNVGGKAVLALMALLVCVFSVVGIFQITHRR